MSWILRAASRKKFGLLTYNLGLTQSDKHHFFKPQWIGEFLLFEKAAVFLSRTGIVKNIYGSNRTCFSRVSTRT
jgi:hypothetical protein